MKQLENLHIAISSITGTPRIIKCKKKKGDEPYIFADQYTDIPKEEWDSALINYFGSFEPNQRQFAIGGNSWNFFIGGNFDSPEGLIRCLKNCIQEVEELKKQYE